MIHAGIYRDVFYSSVVHKALIRGSIVAPGGDARSLVNALLLRLERVERVLKEDARTTSFALSDLEDLIRTGVCMVGSPFLTNVAFSHPTLSSCSAVPLPAGPFISEHAEIAATYYGLNMGSGYNLDSAPDPVALLYQLNDHALNLSQSDFCERYIGNMAHVSVHHPQVRRFLAAKLERPDVVHFNISVDVSEEFMAAVEADDTYALSNGRSVQASEVWEELVYCAWKCGDPGVISLERFNQGNAAPATSSYVTTAPCAEVGLAPGETCVFGYINLAACLILGSSGLELDEQLLARAARCLTRILDDAVQESLSGSPSPVTTAAMSRTRKIGIGVCGYADALLLLDIDYGSDASCAWLNRVLSTINYASKHASMELSSRRGPFGAYGLSRYRSEAGFLTRSEATALTPGSDAWRELERDVGRWGLRNAMTTALPPSGRSSILLGVNSSIEPYLTFASSEHSPLLLRLLAQSGLMIARPDGSVGNASTPAAPSVTARNSLYRRAVEISPSEHLAVIREAAGLVDDGVSKTVNLRWDAPVSDVAEIYLAAWRCGLKAISVYREPEPDLKMLACTV